MIKLLIFSATLLVVAEASKWGQQQRSNNRRLITWKSAHKQFSKRQKDWNDGYAWKFDTDEEMVEGAPVSAYQHVTARCNDQYPKYSVPWATCISNGFRKVSHYDGISFSGSHQGINSNSFDSSNDEDYNNEVGTWKNGQWNGPGVHSSSFGGSALPLSTPLTDGTTYYADQENLQGQAVPAHASSPDPNGRP